MAPITDHIGVEDKPKLGGGGPGKIPRRHGFGGGGDDGDHDRFGDFVCRKDRLRRYRIGIVLGMASVAMLFIGLTSAYFVRRGMARWNQDLHTTIRDWQPLAPP